MGLPMEFQWIGMRISEEQDRRRRENAILERLPGALEELREMLAVCIRAYNEAFGPASAAIELAGGSLRVTGAGPAVQITVLAELPGFQVTRAGESFEIEIGLLPGDKLFYKFGEQYLTYDQLTRRILDRTLFPKLGE